MKELKFSFIVPVYNRPNEIKELLESFITLKGNYDYEIVIIEDGSTNTAQSIVNQYKDVLNIAYYYKANSGPGDSRNYGMQKAKGNYYIILDSDVILPSNYLISVCTALNTNYVDCFGGPDAALESFSDLQKAINFVMTSFITTGGIRGHKTQIKNFQPRSFNMGLSKNAFITSGGFGRIHPGEDPDLSLRLRKLGFKTCLISEAHVYHKRRISWRKFYTQVNKFGKVRPIINHWHPASRSIVFWFPTCFIIGVVVSIILLLFKFYIPIIGYLAYICLVFCLALISTKSLKIAILSIGALGIQFYGYGMGFLLSSYYITLLKRQPEIQFPNLFFKAS